MLAHVGASPGTLVRMTGAELNSMPGNSSVHQLGVADLLVALGMLAERKPEAVLLGVQPENTHWSSELSQRSSRYRFTRGSHDTGVADSKRLNSTQPVRQESITATPGQRAQKVSE
jgi:hydrogenase maturation protease